MAAGPAHIIVTVDTTEAIELGDFVAMFTALSSQYSNYIKSAHPELIPEAKIFIRELRAGSIIADLIPFAKMFGLDSIVPYMQQIDIIADFVVKYGHMLAPFLAAKAIPAEEAPPTAVSDLNDFFGTVAAIANDTNGHAKIEAATYEDGQKKVRAAIKFDTSQARSAVETIAAERVRLESTQHGVKKRVLMVFTQTNVKVPPLEKRTSERVIIEEIAPADKPLVYASGLAEQQIKHEIKDAEENVYKKGFMVDVAIIRKRNKIVAYKVINLHQVIDCD